MEINDAEALELTYDLVATTMQSHDLDYMLSRYMHRVVHILGAQAALVRVVRSGELVLVDSTGLKPESKFVQSRVILSDFCETILSAQKISGVTGPSGDQNAVSIRVENFESDLSYPDRADTSVKPDVPQKEVRKTLVSVLLKFKNTIQGSYQFFIPTAEPLGENAQLLLDNVGKHLGFLIEQARLDYDTGRLLLVEERTRMANEMHDSLAQTLASLRIQVRVLDETLHQGNERMTWQELEKLESQVEQANLELRSLIGRFRAPLRSHLVVDEVERSIAEFRQATNVSVFFQNEWKEDFLSSARRTDVVRIVQEALANIRKHANATNVRVLLRHQANRFKVMIEDDGEGFEGCDAKTTGHGDNSPESTGEHVGHDIMSERAKDLGAELWVESEPGEGTRISLEFVNNDVE
jgi:two-component system nitrate/nitrite sensor histidine kinase NarX